MGKIDLTGLFWLAIIGLGTCVFVAGGGAALLLYFIGKALFCYYGGIACS